MRIRIDEGSSGGSSLTVIKYKENIYTSDTYSYNYDIRNDFPNYASLTTDNFIVADVGSNGMVKNPGGSPPGYWGAIFYPASFTYNSSTGILAIQTPKVYGGCTEEGYSYSPVEFDVYIYY